jgi:para-nitrobenzyl esterase
MSRTWLAFAHTVNPNNERIPNWPPYSAAQRPTMMFDNQCRVENDPYGAERRAWDIR